MSFRSRVKLDAMINRDKKIASSIGVVCESCNTAFYFSTLTRDFKLKKTCLICENETEKGAIIEDFVNSLVRNIPNHYYFNGNNSSGLPLSEVLKRFTYKNDSFIEKLTRLVCEESTFFNVHRKYNDYVDDKFTDKCIIEAKELWNKIAYELKHQKRFSNNFAVETFQNIISMCRIKGKDIDGKSIDVYRALTIQVEDSEIFRARVLKNEDSKKVISEHPEKQLNAPPEKFSQNNRMSPSGISFFYAAADRHTAISEVHPFAGDEVAVGTFNLKKDMHFFDFTTLNNFDVPQADLLTKPLKDKFYKLQYIIKFLHDLIAKPFRSTDTSYIETQVFAEVIRNHHHKYDGIIFYSTQTKNRNFVIFGRIEEQTKNKTYDVEFNKNKGVEFHKVKSVSVVTQKS